MTKPRIEARDSETKEWVDKRSNAWHRGYEAGEMLIKSVAAREAAPDGAMGDERYLYYLYLQGMAQAFTNLAREVGEINAPHLREDPQRRTVKR